MGQPFASELVGKSAEKRGPHKGPREPRFGFVIGFKRPAFLLNGLGCGEYELGGAVIRALQLYSDLKEVKLFNRFRYFYHTEISEPDLRAAMEMKKNYLRLTKGRANRIGHNWEACVEWFIDRSTTGAKFWSRNHRNNGMDPRRITVHLVRSVG